MLDHNSEWVISQEGYSRTQEIYTSSVFSQGNGYFGTRGAHDEEDPSRNFFVGTYINGIYDETRDRPGARREIVNVPDWTGIQHTVDGEQFDLAESAVISCSRTLNLKTGILSINIIWMTRLGKQVAVSSERYVAMHNKHIGCIRYAVKVNRKADISIKSGIDISVQNKGADSHFLEKNRSITEGKLFLEIITREKGYTVGLLCGNNFLTGESCKWEISHRSKGREISSSCRYTAVPGNSEVALEKYVVLYANYRNSLPVASECRKILESVQSHGYAHNKEIHSAAWKDLWDKADMRIEGDGNIQAAVRFSIYHLLISAPYYSDRISFPARSLSGQDHGGSIYWDTDIFILPFFLYTLPEVAKNMLVYRYRTLPAAKEKARELGYKGAFFAFGSQETGTEQCPSHIFTDVRTGRKIRSFFRDRQIHISADIAYAVHQYYAATGDIGFLENYGLEIMLETAVFHASRFDFDSETGKYMITQVVGPDEYHENVDNNAYTNAMVADTFRKTLQLAMIIRKRNPARYYHLLTRIDLPEHEVASWNDIPDKIYLQVADEQSGLIAQFDGYWEKEDISVEALCARKCHPDQYLGGESGPAVKTRVIKQADVIMQLYLLRQDYSRRVKKANWLYYEPRTEHGSSLSPMAYAIVAADAGMKTQAYNYFLHALMMDFDPKERYFSGYFNHGIHPCALSGAWLTIVQGFLGLVLEHDRVVLTHPYLPDGWLEMEFTVRWRSNPIHILMRGSLLQISISQQESELVVPVTINERHYFLQPGTCNELLVSCSA